jgi:RNA polymerase sigma factor (sigma-70 family)
MHRSEREEQAEPTRVEESEAALVRRVAAGDVSAFEMLYRSYYRRLTRFVEQLTRKRHLIDEIIDDSMLVVWRKAGSFTGQSRVSTWIFAIAYHEVMRAHHRERRASRVEPIADAALTVPSVEADCIESEAKSLLRQTIGQLSVEQRVAIELTYFHGFGYKEIAAITGCPVNTVKTRVFHARRRLRALLLTCAPE